MARARTLHPSFFTDEKIVEVSFAARLLFAGLWCEADREGRLEDKPIVLKMRLFPADSIDVSTLLAELAQAGLVERYEVAAMRLLFLPHFTKHQHVHPKEAPSKLPAPGSGSGSTHVRPSFGVTSETVRPSFDALASAPCMTPKPGLSPQTWPPSREKAEVSREKVIASPSVPQAFRPSSLQDLQALKPSSPSGPSAVGEKPRLRVHTIVEAPDGGQEIDLGSPETIARHAEAWLDRAQALRDAFGQTDKPGNKVREWAAYFFAKYQPEDAGEKLLEAFKDFLAWCTDTSKSPGWGLWLREDVWGPRWDTVRIGDALAPAQGRPGALLGVAR